MSIPIVIMPSPQSGSTPPDSDAGKKAFNVIIGLQLLTIATLAAGLPFVWASHAKGVEARAAALQAMRDVASSASFPVPEKTSLAACSAPSGTRYAPPRPVGSCIQTEHSLRPAAVEAWSQATVEKRFACLQELEMRGSEPVARLYACLNG